MHPLPKAKPPPLPPIVPLIGMRSPRTNPPEKGPSSTASVLTIVDPPGPARNVTGATASRDPPTL